MPDSYVKRLRKTSIFNFFYQQKMAVIGSSEVRSGKNIKGLTFLYFLMKVVVQKGNVLFMGECVSFFHISV